jgi:hypothetical protein
MSPAEKTDQRQRATQTANFATELFLSYVKQNGCPVDDAACDQLLERCWKIARALQDFGQKQIEPFL